MTDPRPREKSGSSEAEAVERSPEGGRREHDATSPATEGSSGPSDGQPPQTVPSSKDDGDAPTSADPTASPGADVHPESANKDNDDHDDEHDDDDDDEHDDDDDDKDDEQDEHDDVAPADAPPSEAVPDSTPPLAEEGALWATVARSVVLSALLGFALVSWLQLSLGADWVAELTAKNEMPTGRRLLFLQLSMAGAAVGLGAVGYWIRATLRKGRNVALIERWLWFASPLLLLPALPSLFHYEPWQKEHGRLLPIVLGLSLVLELLVFRSLSAAPGAIRRWWAETRAQIPDLVKRRGPLVVVVLGACFYVAFFSFYTLRWHYKLRTGNFDLSINNNLMFGGLHGHFLESTVVFPDDPKKYLANHAKFGGYLFLPIYAIYPRPETLLVLQSTLIGLGALPLWGFARRHLSEWLSTFVVLTYLCYYPMHGASFAEFQYLPMAGFFVFTLVWAVETRRWVIAGITLVTGMLMREDIPIGMAVVGGFFLLSGYRPYAGLVIALVSTSYFLVLRFYVMESAGQWWFPKMYKELWAEDERGFRSVIKTLLTNPLFVLSKILGEKKLEYLMHLFVPLVFLPARRWYLWAAFVPGTLLTLLITNYNPPISFSFHYVMHWTPYLFLATVLALKAIGETSFQGPLRRNAAAAAMAGASLALTYNYGAFPQRNGSFKGGFATIEFTLKDEERARHDDLYGLIAMIPAEASVAATEKLGPHVSSRVKMYAMRHGPQNAEYILAAQDGMNLSETRPKLYEALLDGKYGVVKRVRDLALIKKGHDTAQNTALIRDWRLDRDPKKTKKPEEQPSKEGKGEEHKDGEDHKDTSGEDPPPG